MSQPKFLILADGDFQPMTSKTANSVIRYLPERVVGVVDRVAAGKTVQDVLGFGGAIPVVGSVAEGLALKPTAVMIGIAPAGGKLPDEWRSWLADALDAGCDLWSGLHTFLADDPLLHDRAKAKGRKLSEGSMTAGYVQNSWRRDRRASSSRAGAPRWMPSSPASSPEPRKNWTSGLL